MLVTGRVSSLSIACKEGSFLCKVCHTVPDDESVSLIDWMKMTSLTARPKSWQFLEEVVVERVYRRSERGPRDHCHKQ